LPSSLNVKSVFTIKPWGKSDLKILLLLAQITSSTTSQIAHKNWQLADGGPAEGGNMADVP